MLAALGVSMTQMAEAIKALADDRADRAAGGGGGGRRGRVLDVRHKSWPQFSGTGVEDWAFAFKRGLRATDHVAYEMLVRTEEMDVCDMDELEIEFPNTDVKRYSAEIYDIVCQAVSGEPLQVIRSVDDMEGLQAWHKLARKYSPKSLARAVQLVGQITNPPKVSDLSKAESELDRWEEQVKTIKRDFKENFSDTVKVGIVTTMMPASIQEMVYQSIGNTVSTRT